MTNPSNISWVVGITELRDIPLVGCPGYSVLFTFNSSPGPHVGNIFQWDTGSTATDDGYSVIKPNDAGSSAGRWILCGMTFPGTVGSGLAVDGHLTVGGFPNKNSGADESIGIEACSQGSNNGELAVSGYGATSNPVQHFRKARGTQASPTMPLSGDNIMSIGCRHYDSNSNSFFVSDIAIEGYLTEDAVSNSYVGSRISLETAPLHGVAPFVRRSCLQILDNGATFALGTSPNTVTDFDTVGSKRWFYGPENPAGMGIQADSQAAIYSNRVGSDGGIMVFEKNNSIVGTITVSSTTTAYNTSSDQTLKTPVGPIDSGRIIDSVSPHEFTWNSDGTKDLGFFAQELHEAIKEDTPHAVHVGEGLDEKGHYHPWGVDNSKLVPILWAEIQSLRKRLSTLEGSK